MIMEALTNKQKIENAIFERAYELNMEAEKNRGFLFPADTPYEEISNASLRKAIKEWGEDKKVFTLTN